MAVTYSFMHSLVIHAGFSVCYTLLRVLGIEDRSDPCPLVACILYLGKIVRNLGSNIITSDSGSACKEKTKKSGLCGRGWSREDFLKSDI